MHKERVYFFKNTFKDDFMIGVVKPYKDTSLNKGNIYTKIMNLISKAMDVGNVVIEDKLVTPDVNFNLLLEHDFGIVNKNELFTVSMYKELSKNSVTNLKVSPVLFSTHRHAYKYALNISAKSMIVRIEKARESFLNDSCAVMSIDNNQHIITEKIFNNSVNAIGFKNEMEKKDLTKKFTVVPLLDAGQSNFDIEKFFMSKEGDKVLRDIESKLLFPLMTNVSS